MGSVVAVVLLSCLFCCRLVCSSFGYHSVLSAFDPSFLARSKLTTEFSSLSSLETYSHRNHNLARMAKHFGGVPAGGISEQCYGGLFEVSLWECALPLPTNKVFPYPFSVCFTVLAPLGF